MLNLEFFRDVGGPTVIDDPGEVEAFLTAQIGVSVSELHSALDYGAADAALVTANSAAASYGWRMYDGTLTAMRDQLARRGWQLARPGGLEVAMRKDKLVQITPAMGTDGTGLRSGHPTCKHHRGSATVIAVEDNQTSLADLAPHEAAWRKTQTWWLMYCIVVREDEKLVRAGLSLPLRVENGRITEWGYRVLLGERPIGSTTIANIPEPAPEPTIPQLRRRAEG